MISQCTPYPIPREGQNFSQAMGLRFTSIFRLACLAMTALVGFAVGPEQSAQASSLTMAGWNTGTLPATASGVGLSMLAYGDWTRRKSRPTNDLWAPALCLIWDTPWKVAGGHLQFNTTWTFAINRIVRYDTTRAFSNPNAQIALNWKLGHGWYIGSIAVFYLPMQNKTAKHYLTPEYRIPIDFVGKKWVLTQLFTIGAGRHHADGSLTHGGPAYITNDFALWHKYGSWELGGVAFGSADISRPSRFYQKQRQVAVGGLVGYNFSNGWNLRVKLGHDLAQRHYGAKQTRVWGLLTLPLNWHE